MSRLGSLRSGPLGVRSFRLLAGGQFTSTIGDYCYAVALPWLVLSNRGGAVLLGTVLACYGVPRMFIPASFAIMPSLLDGDRLAAGNAISTAAVQAGSLVGPALGGALVAATRASTWAFAIDAASFAVSAATLALIPRRPADGSVATGATEAQSTADTDVDADAGGAALFVAGAANGLGNVTFLTVLQKWAPPALLGRVMSALMLCAFGSFPLSVAISGVLVRHIGPSLFFPIAGAVVAVAILGGLTQREFREFGACPREPEDADAEEPLASQRRAALSGLMSDEGARREESA